MEPTLLTTTAAARRLGVGISTIKRWSDAGLLPCVKTPGRHRRFEASIVEHFLKDGLKRPTNGGARVESLMERAQGDADAFELQILLLAERSRAGHWWAVADSVLKAYGELQSRWDRERTPSAERAAVRERLARAIGRCADAMPAVPEAPLCFLAAAPGETSDVALRLAELVVRDAGWRPVWAGAGHDASEIAAALDAREYRTLYLSAGAPAESAGRLRVAAGEIAEACRARRITLILGGAAPWPEGSASTDRDVIRSQGFETLHEHLARNVSARRVAEAAGV